MLTVNQTQICQQIMVNFYMILLQWGVPELIIFKYYIKSEWACSFFFALVIELEINTYKIKAQNKFFDFLDVDKVFKYTFPTTWSAVQYFLTSE